MAASNNTADQFLVLAKRFIRLRPRLVLPDERMSTLRGRIRALRRSNRFDQEDQWYLFRIPLFLTQRSTPPTMSEVSAELGIPMSSASRMADWLVRARIVQRRSDPHDRRVVRLCMTENGQELLRIGGEYMRTRIRELLQHFTPEEQQQLLKLMTKLIDSIEAEGHGGTHATL